MDIDLTSLEGGGVEKEEDAKKKHEPPAKKYPVSSSTDHHHHRVDEVARRQERAKKRGGKLRDVLGLGAKYVIDLGEYKKKRVKVFVQYEGFGIDAVEAGRRLRVAITIPEAWVEAPASRLKNKFLETYNGRRSPRIDPADALLAISDTRSYLTFAKTMIPDDAPIGDFRENEEIFVLRSSDAAALDAEVARVARALDDYEREAIEHRTIDPHEAVEMTTVSREVDPYAPHVFLVGMGQLYMLPVEPTYTVADIKAFIHFKGGPDKFPLPSIDVALLENAEINVLGDDLAMEDLAKRVYGDDCTLLNPADRKVAIPLYWGKRLQDPAYFLWIPSLHTPDSFRGPSDLPATDAGSTPDAAAALAQQTTHAGGDCPVS